MNMHMNNETHFFWPSLVAELKLNKSSLDSFYYDAAHLSKVRNLHDTKAGIFIGILDIRAF